MEMPICLSATLHGQRRGGLVHGGELDNGRMLRCGIYPADSKRLHFVLIGAVEVDMGQFVGDNHGRRGVCAALVIVSDSVKQFFAANIRDVLVQDGHAIKLARGDRRISPIGSDTREVVMPGGVVANEKKVQMLGDGNSPTREMSVWRSSWHSLLVGLLFAKMDIVENACSFWA